MEPTTTQRHHTASRKLALFASLGVAAVATAAPLLIAQPAFAVSGLQRVSVTSPTDSNSSKVVVATCPSGTRAVGGGAVIGGTTRVHINSAVPSPTGYTVLAAEPPDGTTEGWFVVAHTTCAPVGSLPGLEYRSALSDFDSNASHSATAACGSGKKLIGIGGVVDSDGPGQDGLLLTALRPNPSLTSVTAVAHRAEAGYTGSWRVKATAVCVNPVPGQSYAEGSTPVDSTSPKVARVACPQGAAVHSGGFDIGSAGGQASVPTFFLDVDLAGDPNRQGVEVSAREDATGYTGSWRAAAFSICAY